MAVLANFLNDN